MARITTPFDDFLNDLSAWIDGSWFVWVLIAAALVVAAIAVVLARVRSRARYRVPQYRRRPD
ncbi:hypothetical protein BH09ACT5_BH09ACT5_06210 [soil metagenome]